MLNRQLLQISRQYFCTQQVKQFDQDISKQFIQISIEKQKIHFDSYQINEILQQLSKSIHSFEDKTKFIQDLSQVILENKECLKGKRYETNQVIRKYLANKWPCVEKFPSEMIDFNIKEFQNNYTEVDEGHNLLQFFRVVVISKQYSNQQIKKISQLYNQHYLRINSKFAIISLYYAHVCQSVDKFQILIKIIDELSMFIEFNQLSTLTLIMETLNDRNTFNLLAKIVVRIQKEFLQKETSQLSNILLSRFDALVDFLKINNLMLPEFEQYCEVQRLKLQQLEANGINRHSMTMMLTTDQEEVLQKIYSQYAQDQTQLDASDDSNEDQFINDLLSKRKNK